MEQRQLEVQSRTDSGKTSVRRIRKEGLVPAVVYSGGDESKQLSLSNHGLLMGVRGCRSTQIFTFVSEDKELNGMKAFIKEVQTEPIKDRVLHVDFLAVHDDRPVVIDVPVELIGEPSEVRAGLAVLELRSYGLKLECLPKDIPAVLQVDVSALAPGESILAKQVSLPEGTTLRSSAGTAVAAVTATRAASMAAKEGGAAAATPDAG